MRQIITSAFLLLLVGSITVQAQRNERPQKNAQMKERMERRMGPEARQQRGPQAMLIHLNLSDEQSEEIKGIMLEGKKESIPLENQLREKKARLRTLSSGDTYDVDALNSVVDEMSELQASIKKIHLAKKGEVRALLNDDQKVMFDAMPDKGERMKKRATMRNRR
jgi:Spy/CpxP family protein refolding chaperone